MRFNNHSDLAGKHAYLSASNYHWLRYTDEKFDHRYSTHLDALRGTELHDFAQFAIKLKQRMPDTPATLNRYINDCIGYRMATEVVVRYSDNAFGTADACKFRDKLLQIFDLKTGVTVAKFDQHKIYAAYFCLEYGVKPTEIEIEMRIYQSDDVRIEMADPMEITQIMDKVVMFDHRIELLKQEANG